MRTRSRTGIKPVFIWVLFIVTVIVLFITIISQQSALKERTEMLDALKTQQTELKQRIEALESEISYMGTDEYVERTARDRLGMVKEGEIVFKDSEDIGASGEGGD